ncbi:hypothetical protein [Altericista sp. CCNU0014]|uniref:hypothetical protein n=1 Tax=Altericista sp. CCNU0014 TaxID=3082949 RepID=UPI00384BE4E8
MKHDFISQMPDKPFYKLIQQKYKGRVAQRSGVSYMNHIIEGAFILHHIYGTDEELIEAYCLHPIFQSDKLLSQLFSDDSFELTIISPRAIILGMKYRRVANSYTIKNKVKNPEDIEIGPLDKVHRMLVADKIQNKKDFMKYMYLKHERPAYQKVSERSVQYFDSWLARLSVSREMYEEVVEQVEQINIINPEA